MKALLIASALAVTAALGALGVVSAAGTAKTGCACTGCQCPDCNGEICTCGENCECDQCGCLR